MLVSGRHSLAPYAGRSVLSPDDKIELKLWLDSYDDIYSNFDSRNYLKRRVSADFMSELRRETAEAIKMPHVLMLLLPDSRRIERTEEEIKSSLHRYFTDLYQLNQALCRKRLNRGLLTLIIGSIVMFLNAWVTFTYYPHFIAVSMKVLLEPAGWFLIWAAFDFLFYDYARIKKDRNFYRELSEMSIHFLSS